MTWARPDLAALGAELVRRGLHARGLALWGGTSTLARIPERLAHTPPSPSRAALPLELFVATRPVPRAEAARALGDALPACLAAGLLHEHDGDVRAPRALLPLGRASLAVCDRWDAPCHRDSTPWPDDSSHHLCGALGGVRAARWLDLGTGSGLAPLGCPGVAPLILGVEVVPATARCAALGAALSGQRNLHLAVGDLAHAVTGRWDVISCNAPIPAAPGPPPPGAAEAPRWRHAEPHFLDRLGEAIGQRLAPGGLAVLHTQLAPLSRVLAAHGGDALSVVYTPPGVPAFAITWWQPHLPTRVRMVRRELTAVRPHLDERDRDAASADNCASVLPELGGS